ncbi:MAG: LysM peptidoglycan-binding domain-containing protein [Caldilineaceae bacterium]|nr:LysM peptidoglycan-binding domain-containing protein [Caldilineaceae bacterium]
MFRSIQFVSSWQRTRLLFVLTAALFVLVSTVALPAGVYAQAGGDGNVLRHGQPANTTVYVVQRGDTLSAIARRNQTTVAAILALNPQIRNPNRLYVGQRIWIPAAAPQPPADFTRSKIFLIALEGGSAPGKPIGCGDSVAPVTVEIAPTRAILRGSLEKLLGLHDAYYGESGLYNALYQSQLSIADVRIENRVAIISLTGQLVQGGVCDTPRIQAQLEQTALQFSTVDRAVIYINGSLFPGRN